MDNNVHASDSALLKKALRLARDEKTDAARQLLSTVSIEKLTADDARSVALAHSYCNDLDQSERAWRHVVAAGDEVAGDRFMLASAQLDLGRPDEALDNLRREIDLGERSGNDYYLVSAVITAASILLNRRDEAAAQDLLRLISDEDGYYLRGVGFRTKRQLLNK